MVFKPFLRKLNRLKIFVVSLIVIIILLESFSYINLNGNADVVSNEFSNPNGYSNSSNSLIFPSIYNLYNFSKEIQGEPVGWISAVAAQSSTFLLGDSAGYTEVGINGSISPLGNFPQGTPPFISAIQGGFQMSSTNNLPQGGVELYSFFPANNKLEQETTLLPSDWTASGNGTEIVSLCYGDNYSLLIEESATKNVIPEIALMTSTTFQNISSKFTDLSSSSFATGYGNGVFLVISNSQSYIYYLTNNTVLDISTLFPLGGLSGLNSHEVAWNGTDFIFQTDNSIRSLNPINLAVKTLYTPSSGQIYFVKSFGNYYEFGDVNNGLTKIYQGNGSNVEQIYNLWGTITDSAFLQNTFVFVGQTPGLPQVLYMATNRTITGNITIKVSPSDSQLMINGQTYNATNGYLELDGVPRQIYNILAYNPSYDYSFKSYTLSTSNLSIDIALNNTQSGIVKNYPYSQVGPNRPMVTLENGSVIKEAGHFGKIAFDYSSPDIIYAATGPGVVMGYGPYGDDGIYKTVNGGVTWTRADFGLPGTMVDALFMNQSNPAELLAGLFESGIYKTVDGGNYWYKVANYTNISNFVSVNSTIYAGYGNGIPGNIGGVISTNNFGGSFKDLINFTYQVAYVTASENYVYALLFNDSLYFSHNYGNSWNLSNTFPAFQGDVPMSISASPFNPNEVFVNLAAGNGEGTIVSYNNGYNYSHFTALPQVRKIMFDPLNSSIIWAGTSPTLWYSNNSGKTFYVIFNIWDLHNFEFDPLKPNLAFDIADQGIYETTNFGSSWNSINGNLENFLTYGVSVSQNGEELFVSMQDYGSLESHNGGISWNYGLLSGPLWPAEGTVSYINPYNSSMIYVYSSGNGYLAVSSDAGLLFSKDLSFTNHQGESNEIFAQIPGSQGNIYFGSPNGIYNGTEQGKVWNLWNGSPSDILSLAVNPNGYIYASNYSGMYVFDGQRWLEASGLNSPVVSIAIEPGNYSKVIVVTGQRNNPVMFESSDYGETFQQVNTNLSGWVGSPYFSQGFGASLQIGFLNISPYPLLAITNHGAYLSTNMGLAWHSISYNLPSTEITGFDFVNDTLYLSTYGGGIEAIYNFSFSMLPGTLIGAVGANVSSVLLNGTQLSLHSDRFLDFAQPGTYELQTFNISGVEINSQIIKISSFNTTYVNFTNQSSSKSLTYTVTFKETGLPSGAPWYVSVTESNGTSYNSNAITTSSFSFALTNGSYSYTIASANKIYAPNLTSGTFAVNDSPLTINVNFIEIMYNVTIQESGLPSNTQWNLTLEGTTYQLTNSSYIFSLPNGTYSFEATSLDYKNISGTITVNGSSFSYTIKMELQLYEITFSETGLASGLFWYVNLSGMASSGPIASQSSYTVDLTNGTYTYSISTSNRTYAPSSSLNSLTVNGSSLNIVTNIIEVTYNVVISESGLPSRLTWYMNLSNGISSGPITGSSYTFSLTNGTYTYTIASANKIYAPSPISSTFSVDGTPVSLSTTFSLVKYTVTFTESGLSSGGVWYVDLTNGIDSGPITSSSYTFSLTNGSYSYTASTSNKTYSPSPSAGSFIINGKQLSEAIVFSKLRYVITFMETGLPLGVNWYVNGSGLSGYESSQANLLFSLANGTYSFTVTNLTSYYTTTTHFTVVISGKNVTENVDYYHWAYITGSISPVNANLDVNGKSVSLNSSGLFNITVPNGTYHVIISSSGYISYYINFSLNSGNAKNLIVSLVPISSPSVPSNTELYAIIGIVVAIVVIGAAIVLVNRKK